MAEIDKSRIIDEKKIIKALEATAKAMLDVEKQLISLTTATQNFDTATKKFTGTQKEVADNQKKLAENTAKLTEAEKKQIQVKENLKRAIKKERDEAKQLAIINDKEAGTLERLIAKNKLLEIEKRKLTSTGRKLRTETKAYNKQIDANNKVITQNRAKTQGLTNTLKGLGKQILGAAGLTGGLTAFFRVIKGGFATTFKFERQMSLVKSVSGATADQFNRLRQSAIALGGSTAFTASEVAGLQKEYAKLGFTASQILDVTAATLDLAAAAGEDLTQAATVAGATLKAFNLNAFEMQRVVDVMAKSFSSSALDLSKFQTAMQDIGPTSSAVNISLERSTANLSLLADRGLDASKAGTSLRNIYLELEKRGLSWDDAMTMINTSTNKASTSLKLFGKRGAVAGLILADNTKEADEFTAAYENAAGAAKEMADINLDNVAGAATKLTSAWEGLVLRTNNSEGALKRFLLTLTDVVSTINTKGKPAIDSMFDERKIEKFGDKWKFFRDQGIGFGATLINSLIRGKTATQELADGLAEIGTEMDEQRKAEQEGILATEAARKKANDERLAQAEAVIAAEVEALELFRKEQELLTKGLPKIELARASSIDTGLMGMNELLAASDRELQNFLDNEQIKSDFLDESWAKRMDLANAGTDFINTLFERQAQNFEKQKERELAAAGENEQARERIEEKFERKQTEIRRRQAIADKLNALFGIGVNTALGITKALPNVILAAFVGTLGALQAATVAATPIPQFAKGVLDFKGGMAEIGEEGRELIQTPKGTFLSPDSSTKMYLPPGTDVIPNPETEKIIEKGSDYKELAESNRQMARSIKNRPIINNNITSGGVDYVVQRGASSTRHLDKYFRR